MLSLKSPVEVSDTYTCSRIQPHALDIYTFLSVLFVVKLLFCITLPQYYTSLHHTLKINSIFQKYDLERVYKLGGERRDIKHI